MKNIILLIITLTTCGYVLYGVVIKTIRKTIEQEMTKYLKVNN